MNNKDIKMSGILLENKDTRKIREILNLKEIRSGRIKISLSPASITAFKKGDKKRLEERHIIEFKHALNTLSIDLYKFANKDINATQHYFEQFLDLGNEPILNWSQIYRNIEADKPNFSVLKWSYYHTVKPNPLLIDNYKRFFELFQLELQLLSSNIKV